MSLTTLYMIKPIVTIGSTWVFVEKTREYRSTFGYFANKRKRGRVFAKNQQLKSSEILYEKARKQIYVGIKGVEEHILLALVIYKNDEKSDSSF